MFLHRWQLNDPGTIDARLLRHVNAEPGACWRWLGAQDVQGYGLISVTLSGGVPATTRAHRVAHICWVGPLLPGDVVQHLCHTPACVNPAHLQAGTQAENVRQMLAAGRAHPARGEAASGARLTQDQVDEIRAAPRTHGSGTELAAQFGVSPSAISLIRRGLTWR